MNTPAGAARAGRGQSGFTLVEVLLVVAVSALLLVPVLLWFSLALRHRPVAEDGLIRMAGTGFLSRYLPQDIAVAGAAAVDEAGADAANLNWEDCRHGGGEGGRRVLVMVRYGPSPAKVVYSEAPLDVDGSPDPARASIWRRECDAATGLGTDATQVLEDVEPGSTATTCTAEGDDAACRQIELVTTPVASGEPVAVVGVRRVDTASVEHLRTGNRVPVAKIDVVSQAVRQPYEVTFSAARSHDPDGQLLCYQWVFPTSADGTDPPTEPDVVTVEVPWEPQYEGDAEPSGPACPSGTPDPAADPVVQARTLPTSGVYYVELTVTDDKGVSSTTYKRIEIIPPDPIARARVQSVSGGDVAGVAVFEFAARWFSEEDGRVIGSEHPDGVIAQYEWVISYDAGGPDSKFVALRAGPEPWYLALPEHMAGTVSVVLTVTDERGRTDSDVAGLTLEAPDPPTGPPPPAPPLADPPHAPPGAPSQGAAGGPGSAELTWTPAPAVDQHRVEVHHTGPGCDRTSVHLLAPEVTTQVLHPNLCGSGSTARARVGTELGGTISWSEWTELDLPAFWATPDNPNPPPAPPEGP